MTNLGDIAANTAVNLVDDYASIYVKGGASGQTNVGTTAQKLTQFAADGPAAQSTPAHASDQITVAATGVYRVEFCLGFSGSNNMQAQIHVRVNAVESVIGTHRKLSAGGDVGSGAGCDLLALSANDVVTLYIESADGGDSETFTLVSGSLSVFRVG